MKNKQEFKMSQARFDELQKELNYLKTTRSDEVAEQIKVARGFGDLSENSEYDEAKNEQGKLYSRIAEVENILLHAVIVEEDVGQTDIVTIGSKVTISAIDSGKTLVFKVVGSQEAVSQALFPYLPVPRGVSSRAIKPRLKRRNHCHFSE